MIRTSVFGLGYVGAVSCACFAKDGLEVIGVDVNPDKVRMINEGQSPIVETQVGELIAAAVAERRLRATVNTREAILATDVSVISVGTPSRPNGSIDLAALERVCEAIGEALSKKDTRHLIVVRSTMLPGTLRRTVIPVLEKSSGKRNGRDFGVAYNPEFLRESTSVSDFYNPPFTLIGRDVPSDGDLAAQLYAAVLAPVIQSSIETAEMVKYVCNAFHALKATFANEIGIVAQSLGVDSHEVMRIACEDTKLNISPKYLRPGFAFGGSCLPKDVRALTQKARERDLELPLLSSLMVSNRAQIDRAMSLVLALRKKKIGIVGLSFKAGTDDLRESPLVILTEGLIGKGCDIKIYDRNISLARLTGANKEYLAKEIPHVSSLLVEDLDELVVSADLLIIGNSDPEFARLPSMCRDGQSVVDLVRIRGFEHRPGVDYHGITW